MPRRIDLKFFRRSSQRNHVRHVAPASLRQRLRRLRSTSVCIASLMDGGVFVPAMLREDFRVSLAAERQHLIRVFPLALLHPG